MRILMIHNTYQQRGGEDISTEQDINLLRHNGHLVKFILKSNDEISTYSFLQKVFLFFRTTWSLKSYFEIMNELKGFKPDLVHVQNFFPLISPSVFYTCHSLKIPVVWSLRNYRLVCANGFFYRDDHVCEDCLRFSNLHGLWHKCYRFSFVQTAAVILMQTVHRIFNTWKSKIDVIAPVSSFALQKMIQAGMNPENLVARPNYLDLDIPVNNQKRDGAIFVGRLSPEKGLSTIMEAWNDLSDVPLNIVGDGPELQTLQEWASGKSGITICGHLPHSEMLKLLSESQFLIMPSLWYETFGRTIIEAYATGTPVIASNLGAVAELVKNEETGLLFPAGDAFKLSQKVRWAISHPAEMRKFGEAAQQLYLSEYGPNKAYEQLMAIYKTAIEKSRLANNR